MPFDPYVHRRRSIRLPGYDYTAAGAYFLTVVTWQRECLLGAVAEKGVVLNSLGEIVSEEWQRTSEIRREVRLDQFVVMPNHMHAVIFVRGVGAHGRAPYAPSTIQTFPPADHVHWVPWSRDSNRPQRDG